LLTYSQPVDAPPERVWQLVARPERWASWAPHLRGASGLGAPEVRLGAHGSVRLLGALPVPARITAKQAGRHWDWKVGPVTIRHRVDAGAHGTIVSIDLAAPGPLEAALRVTYGPVIALLLRNLARVAAGGADERRH
jgi:Polyketide cyclase / dehydrase and lipid transport